MGKLGKEVKGAVKGREEQRLRRDEEGQEGFEFRGQQSQAGGEGDTEVAASYPQHNFGPGS
jgi:hypothetical protein